MTTNASNLSKTLGRWSWRIGLLCAAFWMGGIFSDFRQRTTDTGFTKIETALLRYHQEHGSFPPTRYQPAPGGPIHSWRVMLAPYLEERLKAGTAEYDYAEWWITPGNLLALGRAAPDAYRMNDTAHDGITHYLAVDKTDAWPSHRMLKTRLVTKGRDRFLLVQHPDSVIHWMEPVY